MAELRRLALLLAACLVVPAVAAADGQEAEGHFMASQGVMLDGRVDLGGPGLLELSPSEGDAAVAVDFAEFVDGRHVDRTRDRVHVGLPGFYEPSFTSPRWDNESIPAAGAGRVENVRCGPDCRIAFVAAPGDGLLGARGVLDARLKPTAETREFHTATVAQNEESQLLYVVPPGAIEAVAAQFADPEPWTSGLVTLVISDATFDLVAGGSRTSWNTRWWTETTQGAAGQPVTVRHHAPMANLTLDGAVPRLPPGAPFRLSFPAGAEALLDGVLSVDDASGVLKVGGTSHRLDHDRLLLEGTLAMRLAGAAPGVRDVAAFDVAADGKATRAEVSGADVMPWRPSAAEAGGGLLALAALAAVGRFFLLPLYHRLGPSDLLANRNRHRIYEAIRRRPGVDVGTLVAEVGLSRVLVRHHLRMLEAHRLVRATVWRRRRTYALAGAGPNVAACELKDATRRRVASAVAQSGGATQKDLAHTLGLSQRLVSYHLACLGDSGLVRAEGRNPRVYLATPALTQALEKEGGPSPSFRDDALARGLETEGDKAVVTVAAVATMA